ncbi:high mobility group B protein 6-like [Pyrus ussuriensis x Pyrus communis]|uniref:High mobility group B protein 6-like n=1 Tax=Pyrus ussuriensis x Pyrus communis TaxID=2448454 RepID=A0A5N5G012_9ROSA|nr:high mobility group B protein 6-like [Pyrus ussuriensis x Pyrus communis]
MADIAIAEMPNRKPKASRRALTDKKSRNEANIVAGKVSDAAPSPIQIPSDSNPAKENHDSLSQPRTSPKKSVKAGALKQQAKQKQTQHSSSEKKLKEMQEKLQAMRLEKEKTEELLKEKDEILKTKVEELETKGRKHDKLQMELKQLQKLKEFKPTMAFPIAQPVEDKKKKGCTEKKRPAPPYILWCKDQWAEIKKENPEADFKEVSNILGAKWKNVSPEEKMPYEERYQKREVEAMHPLEEEHKQKMAMELLEQYMQFKQEAKKENKQSKKEKDPLKPKHPMSAFFLFTNDRKNKEKYMQEMEAYKEMKEEEASNLKKEGEELMKLQKHEALQLLKKKKKTENIIKLIIDWVLRINRERRRSRRRRRKKRENADPNKPKKPASSYLLFSKEARKALLEERPGTNSTTITAMISLKWKEMKEEEKKVWNEKAAEAMEAYKKVVWEHNKSVVAASSSAN